uniref:AGC-kinase C-terminal domain-containing protein n=1 Tax=Romanomermis culicivorax TaxID=13658 RepID=A0A915JH84_ROMCU
MFGIGSVSVKYVRLQHRERPQALPLKPNCFKGQFDPKAKTLSQIDFFKTAPNSDDTARSPPLSFSQKSSSSTSFFDGVVDVVNDADIFPPPTSATVEKCV